MSSSIRLREQLIEVWQRWYWGLGVIQNPVSRYSRWKRLETMGSPKTRLEQASFEYIDLEA